MMTVGEWLKKTFNKDKIHNPNIIANMTVSSDDDTNTANIAIQGAYPKSVVGQFITVVFKHQNSDKYVDIDDIQVPETSIYSFRKENVEPRPDVELIMDYGVIVRESIRILTTFKDNLDFSCVISNYVVMDEKESELSISIKIRKTPDDSYDLLKSIAATLRYELYRTDAIKYIDTSWGMKHVFMYNTEGM